MWCSSFGTLSGLVATCRFFHVDPIRLSDSLLGLQIFSGWMDEDGSIIIDKLTTRRPIHNYKHVEISSRPNLTLTILPDPDNQRHPLLFCSSHHIISTSAYIILIRQKEKDSPSCYQENTSQNASTRGGDGTSR